MEYSSRFKQEVRQKLENLKSAIEQDLGTIDSRTSNLTFSQADEILTGATALLDSYKGAMAGIYRATGKPAYRGRRIQPSSSPRGRIEPAAVEAIQSQGYLLEKEFVAQYGFNRNAASRKLQELAQAYGWERERSEEGGWRYTPGHSSPSPQASSESAPALQT